MALIKCKDCGGVVSDTAPSCPHCGCPVEYSININQVKEKIPDDTHQQEEIPVHYRNKKTNNNSHKYSTFIIVLGIIVLFIISVVIVYKFFVPKDEPIFDYGNSAKNSKLNPISKNEKKTTAVKQFESAVICFDFYCGYDEVYVDTIKFYADGLAKLYYYYSFGRGEWFDGYWEEGRFNRGNQSFPYITMTFIGPLGFPRSFYYCDKSKGLYSDYQSMVANHQPYENLSVKVYYSN